MSLGFHTRPVGVKPPPISSTCSLEDLPTADVSATRGALRVLKILTPLLLFGSGIGLGIGIRSWTTDESSASPSCDAPRSVSAWYTSPVLDGSGARFTCPLTLDIDIMDAEDIQEDCPDASLSFFEYSDGTLEAFLHDSDLLKLCNEYIDWGCLQGSRPGYAIVSAWSDDPLDAAAMSASVTTMMQLLAEFTPVVLCETSIDRLGQTFELGPRDVLFIRTTKLPDWAQSNGYDAGEVQLSGMKSLEKAGAELTLLASEGHAFCLPNVTYVHSMVNGAGGGFAAHLGPLA